MSSTTTESSATSVFHTNPFAAVRRLAEEREERTAAEQARQAEERRLQREQRERDQKVREFQRNVKSWVHSFFNAVAKQADSQQWKPGAIDQAQAYAEALVLSQTDAPLPAIDPSIAKVIQDKFTYGIVLDQRGRGVIPENFFNGQRQDWFTELLKKQSSGRR